MCNVIGIYTYAHVTVVFGLSTGYSCYIDAIYITLNFYIYKVFIIIYIIIMQYILYNFLSKERLF